MVYHMFRLKTIIKMTFNHFDYPCSGIEIRVIASNMELLNDLSINSFIGKPIGQIFCS